MRGFRFLLGNIFWLGAVRIFTKVTTLLTLPIVTYYLSPKDFGILAMFAVIQTFLSGIFSMGLSSYAGRVIYRYERYDRQKCREHLGALLIFLVAFSFVGSSVSLLFIDPLSSFFISDLVVPKRIYLYIPVFMAFIMCVYGFVSDNILNLQINKKIFYIELLQFILFMPIQLVGLCFWGFDVWDIIILQSIVQFIITLSGLWSIREWLVFSVRNLSILREALRYSLPMVPLNFLSWIQDRIDKVYLNSIISLNAVGLYSAGVNIANQYSFLSRPVMTTIKPEISKRLDSGDEGVQGDIKDAFLIFFQISLFLYLLMSLFSKEIVQLLMNERFHECYRIVPIFLLGIIIAEVTGIFQLKFVYKNQTVWFPITLFCSALLNVALNYFLIPFLDIYGAALSKTLTEMGLFVLTYIIAQRLHKTEYELMTNVWPLLIVIAITYISDNLTVPPLNLFIFKVVAACIYGFSLDFFLLRVSKRYGEVRKMFMGFVSVNLKRL